jgi:hypothetical protein
MITVERVNHGAELFCFFAQFGLPDRPAEMDQGVFVPDHKVCQMEGGTDHVGPILQAFDMIEPVNIRFLQKLPESDDIPASGAHQATAFLFV